jgi:hypothetical protein
LTAIVATPDDLAAASKAMADAMASMRALVVAQGEAIGALIARVNALEAAAGVPPVSPPPAPVIETPPPVVVDDPTFDGPVLPLPPINGTLDITGKRYRVDSLPNRVAITGRGELIIPDGKAFGPEGVRISGAVISGGKPRQQCTRIRESLATEFGADRLSLAIGESRTSAPIQLDPSKRYGIWILPGFVTGDNARPVEFLRCDAAGNVTGTYDPQLAHLYPDNWIAMTGSAGLRVQVSAARIPGVTGTPTYDLTKIRIYEAVNDLATLTGPYENRSQFYLGGGNVFTDVLFRDMLYTPMKIVSGAGSKVIRGKVRHCLSGFSTQNASGSTFEDADIDLHCLDDRGDRVPVGIFYRARCIGVGGKDTGASVLRGKLTGASWAIEAHESGGPPHGLTIDGTAIDAVHAGISNNAQNAVTRNVTVKLGPLGYTGIEHNLDCLLEDFTISQPEAAMKAYGIAHANVMAKQVIRRGKIRSGVAAQFWDAERRSMARDIQIEDIDAVYSMHALSWNVNGVAPARFVARRSGAYAMTDQGPLRALNAGPAMNDRGGNNWET